MKSHLARARRAALVALTVLAASASAPEANAAPRTSVVSTQTGVLLRHSAVACAPQVVRVSLAPGTKVERLSPDVGDVLGDQGIEPAAPSASAAWRVTGATVVGDTAVWSIEPVQPSCDEFREGGYAWYFEARWNATRYRAHLGRYGATQLAGMRLSRRKITRYPLMRRALGRPTSMTVRSRSNCVAEWRRLGLRVDFRNYGGGVERGCRYGHPQVAHLTKPELWAVTTNSQPAVLSTTSIRGLEESLRARRIPGRRAWSIASMQSIVTGGPVTGAAGFADSHDGRFRRFEVFVGHAGE